MTPRRLIEPARLASTAVLRGQSDERLIDLTRAGNERAFEAIVHRYRQPLLRYCGRILPPGRAEDAVQQAFLSAHNAIANGDKDLKLRPWLYRVARNSALNLLRQNGWDHDQLDEQFDGVLRPDQAVETRERIQALVASVKGLPERQRDAIVLRELEGRSYEEIAAALGVTDGAVRQLLNRARSALRAGATAITPYGLLERIADVGTGAGGGLGGLSLAKLGAAVLVTGAVATGAANHGVPVLNGSGHHHGDDTAAASAGPSGAAAARAAGAEQLAAGGGASRNKGGVGGERRRHRGSESHRGGSHRHGDRAGSNGDNGTRMVDERSGDRHSGSGGSGGEDHSGSGSGDTSSGSSGDGSSGSGSGDLTSGDLIGGTSGASGSSGDGSSGSGGTDGSGSSGSGDGGGTTTTSTSGSSGSGSSGSGDPTTTTSSDGSH